MTITKLKLIYRLEGSIDVGGKVDQSISVWSVLSVLSGCPVVFCNKLYKIVATIENELINADFK